MKPISPQCPNCGGEDLYRNGPVSSGGGYGPVLLPDLGGWLHFAKMTIVVCADCGLTRFFADPEATGKLPKSDHWRKL
jgi:predicted nucleic-acid-binding Zn-ribbon protein